MKLLSAYLLITCGLSLLLTQQFYVQSAQGFQSAAAAQARLEPDQNIAWEEYKKSPLYLEPFDPEILALQEKQLNFLRQVAESDTDFFREILKEAIERRNQFGSSVTLIFKYTAKLLGRFIKHRREEQQITPRIEPKPEYFAMLANFVEAITDQSTDLKREKYPNKKSVDVDQLDKRVNAIMAYIKKIINTAPVGAYLRWDNMKLYMDEPSNPMHGQMAQGEAADLLAQFRAIGYERSEFVARRIVNLLRMFAKGTVPPVDEV